MPKIHIVGHSAGSIFHAPLITALNDAGVDVETCTLWAPACTVELFKQHYVPAIKKKRIKQFALFALSDKAEQDDHCANIYHKSLLYLVSHSFEDEAAHPAVPEWRARSSAWRSSSARTRTSWRCSRAAMPTW